MVRGIRRKGHEEFPFASFIACLFAQLPLGCFQRCLTRVDDPCHQFIVGLTQGMPVLVFHHHLTVLRDGDHIDPIGKLHHKPSRDLFTGGKFYALLSNGQPGSEMQDIFTFHHLPRAVF